MCGKMSNVKCKGTDNANHNPGPGGQMSNVKGQTLLELVVVIAVIVIVIGALVFATIASLRNAQFSKNQAQATKLAQEGLELVRSGRGRNKCINSLPGGANVNSWNGGNTSCLGGAIWDYQISGASSVCAPPLNCFFNISNNPATQGVLSYITSYSPTPIQPLPPNSESIPPFTRAVIITDDSSTYQIQKTVTVIVTWIDISGEHESRLTTILGKI